MDKLKGELPDHIKLEHYTSQTFLGLFVAEEHNDVLKKLAVQFMREVSEFSKCTAFLFRSTWSTWLSQVVVGDIRVVGRPWRCRDPVAFGFVPLFSGLDIKFLGTVSLQRDTLKECAISFHLWNFNIVATSFRL